MIRGYHEYKLIWNNPVVGEDLLCECEVGNPRNTYVVAVKKVIDGNLTMVGHILRRISSICSMFLRRGGKLFSPFFLTNGLKIVQYRHLVRVMCVRATVLTHAFK